MKPKMSPCKCDRVRTEIAHATRCMLWRLTAVSPARSLVWPHAEVQWTPSPGAGPAWHEPPPARGARPPPHAGEPRPHVVQAGDPDARHVGHDTRARHAPQDEQERGEQQEGDERPGLGHRLEQRRDARGDRTDLPRVDPHRGIDRRLDQAGGDDLGQDRILREEGGQQAGRERQASACEPGSQQVTRPGEPALDRPDRPFEEGGHLLVRLPLQVAEDDGLAIFLGESADLLMQHGPELVPCGVVVVTRGQHRRALPFPSVTPGRVGLRSYRRAVGHLVEPVPQHLAIADRPGLADEQEERGLEGVLRVLRLVEHVPADAEDHRPMPPDEHLEGGLRLRGQSVQEPRQQLAIAHPLDVLHQEGRAAVGDDRPRVSAHHVRLRCPAGLSSKGAASHVFGYNFSPRMPHSVASSRTVIFAYVLLSRARSTRQTNTFASWIVTFGSPTRAERSLTTSPVLTPL